MALDLPTLITEIEAAYQDAEDNPGAGNNPLATAVAIAVDKFVKTGEVDTEPATLKDSLGNPCVGTAPIK